MDDLARLTCNLRDLYRKLSVARAGLRGLLTEAAELKVPMDDLPQFLEPVTDSLLGLCQESLDAFNLSMDVGARLRGKVRP